MSWSLKGDYFENCSCEILCPCITSSMAGPATYERCQVPLIMHIEEGEKDGVKLDGLSFIVLMHAPKAMGEGGITVGLIVDERANDKQTEAISAIATGAAGGPMAALGPLVGRVAGMEKRPISFDAQGLKRTVKAGQLVDQSCEGVPSPARAGEPIYLDNTLHPVNPRLALAKATRTSFHAFGIDWDDSSGTRNGHFAPFAWIG